MNKTDKLVVAMLFAALFGFFFYNSRKKPAPPPQKPAPNQVDKKEAGPAAADDGAPDKDPDQPGDSSDEAPSEAPDETPKPPDIPDEASTPSKPEAKLDAAFAGLQPAEPVTLTVDGLSRITIDPEKGGIVAAELMEYREQKGKPEHMALGHPDYPMLSLQDSAGALQFSHADIREQTDTKLVIARQLRGSRLIVEQTWETQPKSYNLNYKLVLRNIGEDSVKLENLLLNAGFMAPLRTPRGFFSAASLSQGIQFLPEDDDDAKIETATNLYGFDEEEKQELAERPLIWVSVQNKFFAALLSADQPLTGLSAKTPAVDQEKDGKKDPRLLVGFVKLGDELLVGGETKTLDCEFYLGPKKYDNLKALGKEKKQVMQFNRFLFFHLSLMEYISLAVFWLITHLVNLVTNYGVAIILATIVIRTLFWPVTHKTTVWSQKMKDLQPEMQALRKQYENDQQMMNQKTMELYRKNKINPFGGCLPMFFQIPVFFALFNVLRSAIALRHAEFLWISDLSMPDALFMLPDFLPWIGGMPFNLLPFIMGGAMFMQQRLMPTSADPMQQKMMAGMSIFIVFICYNMPAGLTLYWTVSNFYTIIQYQIIHAMLGTQKKNAAGEGKDTNSSKKDKPKKK